MVEAYILVQTEVGKAADVAAHIAKITGVTQAEDVTGPYDVIVRAQSDNVDDLGRFVQADRDFHLEIGAAAGNVVLRDLLQNVRSLLRVWTERILRDEVLAEITYAEHAAVFAAIRDRDPAAAGRAMASHMESAGARLLHAFEVTAAVGEG